MHKSTHLRMEYLVKYYEPYFLKDKVKVLDIGSYDVGGTYRDIFQKENYQYEGLDVCEGPNVDIVPNDIYSWDEIPDNTYDLVISGQAFEHIEYPWLTIREIARVLKPSGLAVITAPNAGPEHRYPVDCYRYFSDGLCALAKWADLAVIHVSVTGIPEKCEGEELDQWLNEFNDAYLVAQKLPTTLEKLPNPFPLEKRITLRETENTYLLILIQWACKEMQEGKPIVLYGAGGIGKKVFNLLGEEKVNCFIDASSDKAGTYYCGKKVMALEDFIKIHDKFNCLVTAKHKLSKIIEEDLKQRGIAVFSLYPD